MRMAFGLVGLLVALGVIVWLLSSSVLPHTQAVLDAKKQVTPKIEQMAGHTTDGVKASDTVKIDAETSAGRMTSVLVTDITAGGAIEKYFGLKRGDSIIDIGPLSVKDMASSAEAKDMLIDAYQRSGQITVMRSAQKLTLPAAGGVTPGATPAGAAPATPAAAPSGNSLQNQLDAIQKVPTH